MLDPERLALLERRSDQAALDTHAKLNATRPALRRSCASAAATAKITNITAPADGGVTQPVASGPGIALCLSSNFFFGVGCQNRQAVSGASMPSVSSTLVACRYCGKGARSMTASAVLSSTGARS